MNDESQAIQAPPNTLIALLAWVLGIFTAFIGPLVIYIMYMGKTEPEEQLAREAARNALNWQLTAIVIAIVGAILLFVVIGVFVLFALNILNLVFCIIGAVKAAQGEAWKSPMTIQFLK